MNISNLGHVYTDTYMFVLLQQECFLDTHPGGAVYFVSLLNLKLQYTSLAVVHILLLFMVLVHQVPLRPIVTLVNKNAWQDNVWLLSPWHNWHEGCTLRRILVLPKY